VFLSVSSFRFILDEFQVHARNSQYSGSLCDSIFLSGAVYRCERDAAPHRVCSSGSDCQALELDGAVGEQKLERAETEEIRPSSDVQGTCPFLAWKEQDGLRFCFLFFSFLFFFFFFLKDLVFWGFDYHAMVNIVRYKVAMIKQKEAEKSGKSGAAAGDYVCLKCGRGMTWAVFVKLASSGSGNPVCQSRGCGGALQKESKRAAEGLKPLEVIARALQRLEGQEIPILGKRTMNATIEEAARKEDEMRPDGDPKYEMPVLGSAKTTYVVQLADAAGDAGGGGGSSGGGGAGSSSVALAPPELKGLVPDRYSVVRKPPPPPWLLPAVEVMETQEAQQPVAVEEKPTVEVVIPVRTLPLEAALSAYPEQLVKQLGATTTTVETVADEELVWDEKTRPVPLVVVGGRKLPMNELTNDHVLEMTVEEYQNYFEVHREECNSRLKTLLM
jgi:hypothetical protein